MTVPIERVRMAKSRPRKSQSERIVHQDCLAIYYTFLFNNKIETCTDMLTTQGSNL